MKTMPAALKNRSCQQAQQQLRSPPSLPTGHSSTATNPTPVAFMSNIDTDGLPHSLLDDQFVDMVFLERLTGLTDKWFYKMIQDGKFPKPIKFGRSSRWLKSEVGSWLKIRIESSRA